jgi:hypothetical protein
MFKFDDEELKDIISGVDPGNLKRTPEMESFSPTEVFMTYGKVPQRLMVYVDNLSEDELNSIK